MSAVLKKAKDSNGDTTDARGPMIAKKIITTAIVVGGLGIFSDATASTIRVSLPDYTSSRLPGQVTMAQRRTIVSSTTAIASIKRHSGLTWDEVAYIFSVSRRSVHNWVSGEKLSDEHAHFVLSVYEVINKIGSASAEHANRILQAKAADGQTIIEKLKSQKFDEALNDALQIIDTIHFSTGKPVESIYHPINYLDAIQENPKIEGRRGVKFARPPVKRDKNNDGRG